MIIDYRLVFIQVIAKEQYVTTKDKLSVNVTQEVAKAKHLHPQLNEAELVHKLTYRFDQIIRVAVKTKSIRRLEDLLILLPQW